MGKKKNKKKKETDLFKKYKDIVDIVNRDEDILTDQAHKEAILDKLFLKADDLAYTIEQAWNFKLDALSQREQEMLVQLIKSSKRLRNKILKIIQDTNSDDHTIGHA